MARENTRALPLSAAQAHRPAARLFVRDTEGRLRDGSRPRSFSRGAMSRRPGGAFDPDDKYSKAKAQNVRSHATPPPVKSRGGVQGDVPRFASQQSSPAQSAESSEMAARVRSKLDAVADRLHGDERESSADLVKGSLDRLAFASQVSQVTDAFGSVGHDALDEVGSLANKATETVALFQAAQYASKWMPIDTHLTMKPTYVKVAAQSAERIKWYEDAAFESIVAAHADERDAILAENAGLRGMLGLEETSSENVARIRETEDGVNRALLMSAAEEIKRLRARELVLEGEAARRRVKDSGFFSFGGADGVDTAQMTRLTTELARLEEDNGRQRWMIGEKDKQIKETQAKFAASEAYALRERLQECTEALQVAANLQAEQLQYLEDNALKKLLKLDDQICDVQDDLDTRAHQLEQLRDVLHHYWAAGDERVAPTVASLAGFARDARTNLFSLKEKREAKTLGGIVTGLGRFGAKLGGGAVDQLLKACAPPPVAMPREGQVLAPPPSEKEKESAAERGAPAATPAATPAASPAKRDTSDDPEDAGYQGDGDASTAPPTAEKIPFSASSSAAPSATATPVKKLESEETLDSEEASASSSASSFAAPAREGGALPSPPFSASASASAPVPGARPARRRDAETAEERAAREQAKRERRDAASGARREASAAAHGHHGRVGKKKDEHFTGFEDEASAAREKRERAAARPALPQPKLLGKAALREEERRKEEEARREKIGGFQGFGGDDADDSDSD